MVVVDVAGGGRPGTAKGKKEKIRNKSFFS